MRHNLMLSNPGAEPYQRRGCLFAEPFDNSKLTTLENKAFFERRHQKQGLFAFDKFSMTTPLVYLFSLENSTICACNLYLRTSCWGEPRATPSESAREHTVEHPREMSELPENSYQNVSGKWTFLFGIGTVCAPSQRIDGSPAMEVPTQARTDDTLPQDGAGLLRGFLPVFSPLNPQGIVVRPCN